MKWIILITLIVTIGDQPQSRPVPTQSITQPLDDLVPLLDSITVKLTDVSTKIEKL